MYYNNLNLNSCSLLVSISCCLLPLLSFFILGGTIKDNVLMIEGFSFVNLKVCKKIIEEGSPEKYYSSLKDAKDFICYSSDNSYCDADESGAPAIRKEHLLAVTVGSVNYENEHVAVGMKIACFCPWIKENLPSGQDNIECCHNCCGWKDPPEAETTGPAPTSYP